MSEARSLGEMVLYEAADGGPGLEVRLERDTVWLSQAQMVDLFERDQSVVSRHLRNVFAEGELDAGNNMQKMHIAGSAKPTAFYSLDVVISVGYRVKSRRGTQFRIWATRVLREHLVRGYTVNERRLRELRQAVRLVADVAERRELSGDEAKAVLRVVSDYAYALDDYDHQRVRLGEVSPGAVSALSVGEARRIVEQLRSRFGGSALFGREKDAGLEGSLAAAANRTRGWKSARSWDTRGTSPRRIVADAGREEEWQWFRR
ncbi:MAG: virulence RhuM family protein [Deferrisomatales bacterium]